MHAQVGESFRLLDGQGRCLGEFRVDSSEGDLLGGRFVPGPDFASAERLFRDFEEAANAQALPLLDDLDAAIASLQLRLQAAGGAAVIPVRDVQIWTDGNMSCRPAAVPAPVVNGAAVPSGVLPATRES